MAAAAAATGAAGAGGGGGMHPHHAVCRRRAATAAAAHVVAQQLATPADRQAEMSSRVEYVDDRRWRYHVTSELPLLLATAS